MQRFQKVYELIETLKQIRGTNDKLIFFTRMIKDEDVKHVFELAYHPLWRFKISEVQGSTEEPQGDFETIINFLKKMIRKPAATQDDRNYLNRLIGNDEAARHVVNGILKKGFRCGLSVKTLKDYIDIPVFGCMLCVKHRHEFACIGKPLWSYKLDGVRAITILDTRNKTISMFTRNGRPLDNVLQTLEKQLWQFVDNINAKFIMLDGELYSHKYHFQDILSQVRRTKNIVDLSDIAYWLFDCVVDNRYSMPLEQRLSILYNCRQTKNIRVLEHNPLEMEEMDKVYQEAVAKGYEGLVVKASKSPYVMSRSNYWLKVKPEKTIEAKVIGIEEGTGKYVNAIGALICESIDSLCPGVRFKVGSGLSDEQRVKWFDEPNKIIGRIVEVKIQELTKDRTPRFPVFIRVREDL